MGNIFYTSNKTCTKIEENYSQLETKEWLNQRTAMYKGTMTISIIYSIIALLLILLGYLTEIGKKYIFGILLPFIVTYIIGTIIIILVLFNKVLNLKPKKIKNYKTFDNDTCPDYWDLVYDPDVNSDMYSKHVNPSLFNYKCVMNSNIFNKKEIINNLTTNFTKADINNLDQTGYGLTNTIHTKYNDNNYIDYIDYSSNIYHIYANLNNNDLIQSNSIDSNINKNLSRYSMFMNRYDTLDSNNFTTFNPINYNDNKTPIIYKDTVDGVKVDNIYKTRISGTDVYGSSAYNQIVVDSSTTVLPLICDTLYPNYLAYVDLENSKDGKNPDNQYRCAYSKLCGVPWSDLNCD